jgi:hypothetical protein
LKRTHASLEGVKQRNQGRFGVFLGFIEEKTESICPVLRFNNMAVVG